ncbi:MAG: zinc-dependent alcohol dehydrogenase family protein [Candidatus Eiseniibacteriota bacterium]|nr:MAG: zinc-dependent alcohol dehydrogenase family protein [Candidatus Eisenbacteria bacterium]
MKAMLLSRQAPVEEAPLELVEMAVPEPREDEILIRILTCGICHTDLHTVEGDLPLHKSPVIPGHQIVGVVEKRGARVESLGLGERVGVAWLHWTCGKCRYCLRGDENLCENARFTGWDADGGYAEFAVVPAHFSYPLPEGLSAVEVAPLLCAGIVGFRALKLSEVLPGETLAMYGFGASAHVNIQIALGRGCRVIVFSRSAEHRRLARDLGATWAGTIEEKPPLRPERAVIFAPAGPLVRHALELVDKGGTVALASIHMTPVPELNYETHLYNEKRLRSVTAATRQDGVELLREAAAVPVRTRTEVFSLTDANRALWLLKESKINGAGVLEPGSQSPTVKDR